MGKLIAACVAAFLALAAAFAAAARVAGAAISSYVPFSIRTAIREMGASAARITGKPMGVQRPDLGRRLLRRDRSTRKDRNQSTQKGDGYDGPFRSDFEAVNYGLA